jgi:hypothetical protein
LGYRTTNIATSEIPEKHRELHQELLIWGAWNRSKRRLANLGSVEGLYRRFGGPASMASLSQEAPAFCAELEIIVLKLPTKPRRFIRLVYVTRFAPQSVCAALYIRPARFAAFFNITLHIITNLRRRRRASGF